MLKKTLSKLLLFVTLTASLLTGCDKENEKISCQVTSFVGVSDDLTSTSTFTYDNRKLVKQSVTYVDNGATFTIAVNYVYGTNGNVTEMSSGAFKRIFTYNSSNQVTKSEEFENATPVRQTEYEYTSGRVTKAQHYEYTGTVFTKEEYETLEYANTSSKNVDKITHYSKNGTVISTTTYEYDNKKAHMADQSALLKIYVLDGGPAENNVTKQTTAYPGSTNSEVTTLVYEFNSDSYITKSVATIVEGPSTYTNTLTFTYTCN